MEKKTISSDNVIEIREFLFKILNNWYYFLLSIILSLLIAFAYTRYSHELYESSTKVLVEVENEHSLASDILYNNFSDKSSSLLNDERQKFLSYPLVFETVKDLRFDIFYYLSGNIKTSESLIAPIKVLCDLEITQKNPPIMFEIIILNNASYELYSDKLDYKKKHNFGERVEMHDYNFIVELDSNFESDVLPRTIVEFVHLKKVTKRYQSKIKIEKIEKESNILELSILEEDQMRGVVFLNKLVKNYIKNDSINKLKACINTVNFIQNEIELIEDSLSLIEIKLQDFKSSQQTPDINLKTKRIYDKISQLETELSTYKYQDKYYSYLENYIENGNELDRLIVPSVYGITNSTLNELIQQLVNIQLEKNVLINGGQINNPSISEFDLQIIQLSSNIKELINNSKRTNLVIIHDLKNRIKLEESSLNSLPSEQRELLNIVRIQQTSEELYTFLLQKKSEAEITSAAIKSNFLHVDPAMYFNKSPLFPNAMRVYSIGILIGFLCPLLILLFIEIINDKIRSRFDLERLTNIDMIGVIGRNHSAKTLLTDLNPKSSIAEGFRALRSNLSYKNLEGIDQVYLVTSSISGEGKTFIASNLSIVFANAGERTLLLGADLRRPKIYEDFDTNNKLGLSTILSGENSIEECTIKGVSPNMDVIVSGPLPSNPSDAFLSENFEKLMTTLKSKYDKIIIDTAPIGLVSDAYIITKYTDINLYVVRQNYTKKELVRFPNDLDKKNRISNLYIVLNDVGAGSGVYGYGRYGYSYNYGYGYGTYLSDSDYFDENEN